MAEEAEKQETDEQEPAQTESKHETDWKAEARKWEARAKENKGAAEKLAEIEESKKSEVEKAKDAARKAKEELDAFKTAAERDKTRASVARETGVPEELIVGDDEDAMREYATKLSEYAKVPAAPKAKTAGKFAREADPDDAKRKLAKQIWG